MFVFQGLISQLALKSSFAWVLTSSEDRSTGRLDILGRSK